MKLTRNGKLFVLVNLVVVSLFFKGLDYYGSETGDRSGATMGVAALLAIAALLVTAWLLLRHENERQHTVSLTLIYHLVAVVIAAFGWCVAYVMSDYVQPIDLAWIGVLGGGSLLAHWLLTRNRAKGINSKKAFL